MHQVPEHPEFIETVKEIKNAEEEYDRIISSAKEKADKILRKAKEEMQEENRKAADEIVELKNEQLREGSKEIEAKVKKTVNAAKEDAKKISSKKLPPAKITKLVKDFISDL